MLVELKPGGRQFSVAHTRAAANYGGYFGEHQATISRDGSRVMFATNFNDGGEINSYMVALPSWVYAGGSGSTPTPTPNPTPNPAPSFSVSVSQVARLGYSASYVLTTNLPAKCRASWSSGYSYGALYDDIGSDDAGLTHSKTLSLGTPTSQTTYAVCQANGSNTEVQVTINIQ